MLRIAVKCPSAPTMHSYYSNPYLHCFCGVVVDIFVQLACIRFLEALQTCFAKGRHLHFWVKAHVRRTRTRLSFYLACSYSLLALGCSWMSELDELFCAVDSKDEENSSLLLASSTGSSTSISFPIYWNLPKLSSTSFVFSCARRFQRIYCELCPVLAFFRSLSRIYYYPEKFKAGQQDKRSYCVYHPRC